MLVSLAKALCVKAISIIALVCSFLLVVPASTFAFTEDTRTVNCLTHADKRAAAHHHAEKASSDFDSRLSAKTPTETHRLHCGACGTSSCDCYGLSSELIGGPEAAANSRVTLRLFFARLQQQIETQVAVSIDRPPRSRSSL